MTFEKKYINKDFFKDFFLFPSTVNTKTNTRHALGFN